MMGILRFDDESLYPALRADVARYRHEVFVRLLKWELSCAEGYEQDEFDRHGAVHLVAKDEREQVNGYARLLPTTHTYLLAKHFPQLLNGRAAPCSPDVWELSRFTSAAVGQTDAADPAAQTRVGKRLLLAAVRHVAGQGARDMVFCTTVAIERLAHRWGVEIQRLGPPLRSAAGLLVAAQIRCSARTLAALTAEEGDTPSTPAVVLQPFAAEVAHAA